MKLFRVLIQLFAIVSLVASGGIAFAALTAGKDYIAINPPQPTDSGDKIEVLEVFSYMCPHCNEFEPKLAPWIKQLPGNVQFRRMPVVFSRPSWETLARTYYSLEALGAVDKIHNKIFAAIHEENVILQNKDTLFDWIEKQGVDRKKFMDAFNSFSVQGKVQRTTQRAQSYGVSGVPTVIVDGKYLVSSSQAGSYEKLLQVVDELIKTIQASKAPEKKTGVKPKPVAQR
jgi:protein dithiol oxidoreductase (disulfide-forming)